MFTSVTITQQQQVQHPNDKLKMSIICVLQEHQNLVSISAVRTVELMERAYPSANSRHHVNRCKQSSSSGMLPEPSLEQQPSRWFFSRFRLLWQTSAVLFLCPLPVSRSSEMGGSGTCSFGEFWESKADWRFSQNLKNQNNKYAVSFQMILSSCVVHEGHSQQAYTHTSGPV